ncbi:MAG: NTP transferase domain-containing protein [Verrucomicrobiota bacterium]|nr:NTP transferase domain-containing protein [Verrucomicrobiota bacterium]
MNSVTLLVLAAGMGSRYGGLKQLDSVGPNGETVIDYSVFDAIRAGFNKVVFIIREDFKEEFKLSVGEKFQDRIEVEYAFQKLDELPPGYTIPNDRIKPWGTGHAILSAMQTVRDPFAVINADDFYGQLSYQKIYKYLSETPVDALSANYCMVGYPLKNTLSEHGSVSRGICSVSEDGKLNSVIELTHIVKKFSEIFNESNGEKEFLTGNEVVSMNMWGFSPQVFLQLERLFSEFLKENLNVLSSEFYIPFAVDNLIQSGTAIVEVLETTEKWFGVTYQEDKVQVKKAIRSLIQHGDYPYSI